MSVAHPFLCFVLLFKSSSCIRHVRKWSNQSTRTRFSRRRLSLCLRADNGRPSPIGSNIFLFAHHIKNTLTLCWKTRQKSSASKQEDYFAIMSDDEINVYSDRDEGDDVEEVVAADADEPDDDEGSNNADDQSAEPNADEDLDESQVDDDRSMGTSRDGEEDDDDGKSEPPQDDISAEPTSPKSAATPSSTAPESGKKKKRGVIPPHARKGRAPAVKGLTIPFRTVKKVC
jgi:hypothetical protein